MILLGEQRHIVCEQIAYLAVPWTELIGGPFCHHASLAHYCYTRSRLDLRKYVFSNRVIDHWNALSDACVTSNTINQFKNCLKWELQPETHSYS